MKNSKDTTVTIKLSKLDARAKTNLLLNLFRTREDAMIIATLIKSQIAVIKAGATNWKYTLWDAVESQLYRNSGEEVRQAFVLECMDALNVRERTLFSGFADKHDNPLFKGDSVREWIKDRVLEEGGYWLEMKVNDRKGCWVLEEDGHDYEHEKINNYHFLYDNAKNIELIKTPSND